MAFRRRAALLFALALFARDVAHGEDRRGYLGVLLPSQAVALSAPVEGTVEKVQVRLGDRVKRGDVLANLDARRLRADLAEAEAALLAAVSEVKKAKLALEEAEERLRRRSSAQRAGAVSEEEVTTAEFQARLARAQPELAAAVVAERQVRVAQLRQAAEEADIRAPFDGVVAMRYVEPGAHVRTGQPLLRLIGATGFQVRFAVPASELSTVSVGDEITAELGSPRLSLRGRVDSLAPEIDASSGMVVAEGTLEVPRSLAGQVTAGAVVRVLPANLDGGTR